ncbi:MAG: hypothetical protein ACE5KA_03340 [Nitrososphaerales archaeon]
MNYKSVYEDIMKIDTQIRFATIFDTNGNIVHTGHRDGVRNLLTPEESKRSLEDAAKIWKLRHDLEPKIGKGRYVLAVYEKLKRITMPLDNEHLVYVTTEPDANEKRIIDSLLRLRLSLE